MYVNTCKQVADNALCQYWSKHRARYCPEYCDLEFRVFDLYEGEVIASRNKQEKRSRDGSAYFNDECFRVTLDVVLVFQNQKFRLKYVIHNPSGWVSLDFR